MRWLVILSGQSNNVGRHLPQPPPTYANAARIFNFNQITDEWGPAKDPLHSGPDHRYGVGPGMALADRLLNIVADPRVQIGLIPCAIGNTYSFDWLPVSKANRPYTAMLRRTAKALQHPGSSLIGLLHFQGENDGVRTPLVLFKSNMLQFVDGTRRSFDNPNLPIVLTRIVTPTDGVNRPYFEGVQQAYDEIRASPPHNVAVVSPPEAEMMTDNLHLTAPALIALGHVAADALYQLMPR